MWVMSVFVLVVSGFPLSKHFRPNPSPAPPWSGHSGVCVWVLGWGGRQCVPIHQSTVCVGDHSLVGGCGVEWWEVCPLCFIWCGLMGPVIGLVHAHVVLTTTTWVCAREGWSC